MINQVIQSGAFMLIVGRKGEKEPRRFYFVVASHFVRNFSIYIYILYFKNKIFESITVSHFGWVTQFYMFHFIEPQRQFSLLAFD